MNGLTRLTSAGRMIHSRLSPFLSLWFPLLLLPPLATTTVPCNYYCFLPCPFQQLLPLSLAASTSSDPGKYYFCPLQLLLPPLPLATTTSSSAPCNYYFLCPMQLLLPVPLATTTAPAPCNCPCPLQLLLPPLPFATTTAVDVTLRH